MRSLRARYWPVSEDSSSAISSGLPCATTWPPCSPAPGPMSTTWSAARIASSSCSTTSTELPRSRRCLSVPISLPLSRWCRPIDGSSSTYITPVSPEPICEASRMRCDSPPERESAARSSERYSSPTLFRKRSRLTISRAMRSPTVCLAPGRLSPSNHSSACFSVQRETSQIGLSPPRGPTRTKRASRRSRVPSQVGQGRVLRNFASSSRMWTDSVSRKRRSRFGSTPSKACSRTTPRPPSPR